MGFRQAVNDWLSIVLKGIVIVIVIIGVLWIGVSVVGNIDIGNDSVPDPPQKKSSYAILLKATGQELYTDNIIELGNGRYEVNGYYELVKNKWIYRDIDLCLDKYYFGDIEIRRRVNE